MSSSYKQKKMKTLATRKKTRKRKMESGMTHEDESGRLFQPPSRRDPRWKKPDVDAIVGGIVRSSKKQRVSLLSGSEDDDDDFDEPEMVNPDDMSDAKSEEEEEATAEEEDPVEEDDLNKPVARLCGSVDDCVAQAVKVHKDIRRADGRQKTKVLVMADTRSVFRALKTAMNVKAELTKAKSKRGVRSEKAVLEFRNVGPLKTPMERFKEANEEVLKNYKSGKLPTLIAEDATFYPYSELSLKHLIFVAKSAQSAIKLDRALLADVQLHTFVLDDAAAPIAPVDRVALERAFLITK